MTLTKDKWFDVCRIMHPETTREEFDKEWEEFIKARDEQSTKMLVN